jgi:hypothetical protein
MADFFGVELAAQFGDAVVGGEGEGFVEVEEAVHGLWGLGVVHLAILGGCIFKMR